MIYGGDDIVRYPHATTPLKGLDLMVPEKNLAFDKFLSGGADVRISLRLKNIFQEEFMAGFFCDRKYISRGVDGRIFLRSKIYFKRS